MMRNLLRMALMALLLLAGHAPAFAADKPLVVESGQIKQLPSATTLQLQATTTGAASINLPHGTAPSSPTNGDCWTTTAVFACRINGATASFAGTNTGDQFTSIANGSLIGNNSGSTGAATAMTGTQATALLDSFTSSLKGLAPASGGGTTNFLRADGSWAAPAGGGGGSGAMTLIASTTLSASATQVVFSSIPGTYRDLVIIATIRSDIAAANDVTRMQLNGDTAAHYDSEWWNRFGFSDVTAAAYAEIAKPSGGTALTGLADTMTIEIDNYAGTAFQKIFRGTTETATTGGPFAQIIVGRWTSTAAVNQVRLFSPANNFVAGSTFQLYGRGS